MQIDNIYNKIRWMKFLIVSFTFILQALCFFSCESKDSIQKTAQQKGENPIVTEILALEKMRLNAIAQFDSTKLKQLLAPEFEMTTAQGELLNTQKMLQILQKRSQTSVQEQHYTKFSKAQLLSENSFAIIKGLYIIERKESHGMVVLTLRYSDLYVKNPNKNWLLVCSHLSRVAR